MSSTARFRTVVLAAGKTATGIVVPDEVVESLGPGKRPPVRVTVGGHTYRSTIAVLGGRNMISLSAENRAKAGVAAGDEVDVFPSATGSGTCSRSRAPRPPRPAPGASRSRSGCSGSSERDNSVPPGVLDVQEPVDVREVGRIERGVTEPR